MIQFTCCVCHHKFDIYGGDPEERMCWDCLYGEDEEEDEE